MQENLFSDIVKEEVEPFGEYYVVKFRAVTDESRVVFFQKSDANGKKTYLIGTRLKIGEWFHTQELLEFKHSKDRAQDEYEDRCQRISEGGT